MEEMPNEELDDNEYMTKNLIETVTLLCRNNLKYNFELKIQGLLAITTDNQNVIVVQINEALPKKGSSVTGHHMGAGNNMMDCNLSPPQTRGLGGNVPNISGMARGMPRAALGRGRLVRRGTLGNSQRMKAPAVAQNQMAARARIRQQLQFTTPQKRPPPSMMRSPGSAPVRAPRPQPSPHHQVEDGVGVMVPYEAPPARRTPVRRPQAVRPKVELVEGDEAYSTPKRPIKREASNCQQSSEVCVLSDEEEFNPPTLKAEVDQSPLRKRHMPVLSCEVDGEGSAIIQDSPGEVSGTEKAVGSQRIQVKSESVPSVEVETMVGCCTFYFKLTLYLIQFVCCLILCISQRRRSLSGQLVDSGKSLRANNIVAASAVLSSTTCVD